MKLSPLPPFIIGIDAGKQTGVCFWRRKDEKVIYSGTHTDFYKLQLFICRTFKDRADVRIFIEHPPTMLYARNESTIRNEELRIMFYAGYNRRESELLAVCLKGRGYDVHLVPPVHEKKWDQRRYTLYTGSNKRTSEHERDAVRLAVVHANWRPELRR